MNTFFLTPSLRQLAMRWFRIVRRQTKSWLGLRAIIQCIASTTNHNLTSFHLNAPLLSIKMLAEDSSTSQTYVSHRAGPNMAQQRLGHCWTKRCD
eukprot:s784_g10.t1